MAIGKHYIWILSFISVYLLFYPIYGSLPPRNRVENPFRNNHINKRRLDQRTNTIYDEFLVFFNIPCLKRYKKRQNISKIDEFLSEYQCFELNQDETPSYDQYDNENITIYSDYFIVIDRIQNCTDNDNKRVRLSNFCISEIDENEEFDALSGDAAGAATCQKKEVRDKFDYLNDLTQGKMGLDTVKFNKYKGSPIYVIVMDSGIYSEHSDFKYCRNGNSKKICGSDYLSTNDWNYCRIYDANKPTIMSAQSSTIEYSWSSNTESKDYYIVYVTISYGTGRTIKATLNNQDSESQVVSAGTKAMLKIYNLNPTTSLTITCLNCLPTSRIIISTVELWYQPSYWFFFKKDERQIDITISGNVDTDYNTKKIEEEKCGGGVPSHGTRVAAYLIGKDHSAVSCKKNTKLNIKLVDAKMKQFCGGRALSLDSLLITLNKVKNFVDKRFKDEPQATIIINHSWDWPRFSTNPDGISDPSLSSEIDSIVAETSNLGAITVVAAGNQRYPVRFYAPAALKDYVITVGAVDTVWSNRNDFNYGNEIDIYAPGVNVPWYVHKKFSGTSYASPIVAGVIINILSINRDLSLQEIKQILQSAGQTFTGRYMDRYANYGEPIADNIQDPFTKFEGKLIRFTCEDIKRCGVNTNCYKTPSRRRLLISGGDRFFRLENKETGKCMYSDSNNMLSYELCDRLRDEQYWTMDDITYDNYFKLTNKVNNKCIYDNG
eukprot:132956_1